MKATSNERGWTLALVLLALAFPVGSLLQPWCWPSRSHLPRVPQRVISPLLLIIVPGLRTDRLHHLGYARDVTPGLDRLAHQGASLTRCWAASNDAAGATSLLLSSPPHITGVHGMADTLPKGAVGLSNLLASRAPHHSVAILGDRGALPADLPALFDEVIAPPGAPGAAQLLDLARQAIARHPDVFVWVDLQDLRPPYDRLSFDARRFAPRMSDELLAAAGPLSAQRLAELGWGRRERRWLSDRHDAALAALDAELDRCARALADDMLLENLCLCITGTCGAVLDDRPDLALAAGADLYPWSLAVPRALRPARRVGAATRSGSF